MVGGRLAVLLAARFEVVGGRHRSPCPQGIHEVPLDLLDPESIDAALAAARPDAVVHAAALADADRCESNAGLAERLNVRATEQLAQLARGAGVRLLYLSTDLVFDGTRGSLTEDDVARPLMVYARTKRAGEQATLDLAPGSAVLRVALVSGRGHGPRGTGTEAIAWSLRAGRPLRLFTDQFRTPVDPESIAQAIEGVLDRGATGIFHLGGPERLSRHDLGLRVARVLGFPTEGIAALRQADQAMAAPRPPDVSLDSTRACRELGFVPRALDDVIRDGRPPLV
jgi:dTDP-4-dehydrorhamnose reductase